jgi:UDP-N-acetylglucosamine transferase subunit ALG13
MRCLPLLQQFLDQNLRIVVACNSIQKRILSQELPQLEFAPLAGYDVKYSRNPRFLRLKLGQQLSNILTRINAENRWVRDFTAQNPVSVIISDNRYGFRHPSIPSVFITHQLQPQTGMSATVDRFVQKFLYRFVNRFTECWIPDSASSNNLSGALSHTKNNPRVPVHFIGPLSRLQPLPHVAEDNFILIILSGPEPQRSLFEEILMHQLKDVQKEIVFVRGLPDSTALPSHPSNVQFYNHVSAEKLNTLAQQAQLVICRSGYTSLMDMLRLKKSIIVVPTPAQSEQEYLAEYLSAKNAVLHFPQQHFNLQLALAAANTFSFNIPDINFNAYKDIVCERIASLSKF